MTTENPKKPLSNAVNESAVNSSPAWTSDPLHTLPADRRDAIGIRLWSKMRELFGMKWESAYGGPDGETRPGWQGALAAFSANEIAAALKACEDWESPFPPTFPEFKALCQSARSKARPNWTEERLGRGEPIFGFIEKLAKGKELSPIAKEELAKMRRIMAGEEVETREESYRKLNLARRWGPL